LALLCCASPTLAADVEWSATASDGNYDSGSNWIGGAPPEDGDTAIFSSSSTTSLFFLTPGTTVVDSWRFVGPNDFTINTGDREVALTGGGIAVVGGNATIEVTGDGGLSFQHASTSDSATIHISSVDADVSFGGGTAPGANAGTSTIIVDTGGLRFFGTSAAANANIEVNSIGATGAIAEFRDGSTADHAEITVNGGIANLSFQDVSTAANATIVGSSDAQINFEDDSRAGASDISLGNGIVTTDRAFLDFFGTSTADNATITANGDFSSIEFHDDSTAGNADFSLIGSSAVLRLLDNSTAGNADITLTGANSRFELFDNSSAENAMVTANDQTTVSIEGAASGGDARFIINDGATFTIADLTTNSTTAGSIEGAGVFDLGDKALTVGSNNLSTEVSGTIDGVGGSLMKVGTGTLTLSGSNTYEGFTILAAGTLELNTTGHTSHVWVEDGAILAGTGSFGVPLTGPGGLTALSGATVAPGPATGGIGTLTVAGGNIVFESGSHFRVDVNASGESDVLVAGFGTVDLTGAILDVIAASGNYALSTSYTIIDNATGIDPITGTFASLNSNLAFLTPSVDYAGGDGNDVILTMTRNSVDFSDVARTPNQAAVAGALETLPLDDPLITPLLSQDDAGARQAFDALSGEIHASVAGLLVDQSSFVRNAILGRLGQAGAGGGGTADLAALGLGGPTTVAGIDATPMMGLGMGEARSNVPSPASASQLAFWTQGFGSWGDFDDDGNAASLDRTLGGFVSGVDGNLGDGWRGGFAVGYTRTDASVDARLSSAEIDSYHIAAYAGGRLGSVALRTGAAWTWHDIDTSRTIAFMGFAEHADASYDGGTGQVFGELALPFATGGVALEPFAGLAYVHVDTDGFTEDGGIAALTSHGADQDVGYSRLGLRVAGTTLIGGVKAMPHASFAWQHAFDDVTPDIALAFAGAGPGFGIAGTPIARDSAFIEAGIDARIAPDATLGMSYQGQLGDGVEDHGLNGRLNWQF
jgi:outer membrane autotransporter protein